MSYADVNGLSLYYEEHGSGEPLVLLHGGIGAGEMFAPIPPELAAQRRVITVDLQGTATRPMSTARCARSRWPTTSPCSSSTSAWGRRT
jgi:pimeloyl-ACP methyl ester carboxylesterase